MGFKKTPNKDKWKKTGSNILSKKATTPNTKNQYSGKSTDGLTQLGQGSRKFTSNGQGNSTSTKNNSDWKNTSSNTPNNNTVVKPTTNISSNKFSSKQSDILKKIQNVKTSNPGLEFTDKQKDILKRTKDSIGTTPTIKPQTQTTDGLTQLGEGSRKFIGGTPTTTPTTPTEKDGIQEPIDQSYRIYNGKKIYSDPTLQQEEEKREEDISNIGQKTIDSQENVRLPRVDDILDADIEKQNTITYNGIEFDLNPDNTINESNISELAEKLNVDEGTVALGLRELNDEIRKGNITSNKQIQDVLSQKLKITRDYNEMIDMYENGDILLKERESLMDNYERYSYMANNGTDQNQNPITEEQRKKALVLSRQYEQDILDFDENFKDRAILSKEGKSDVGADKVAEQISDYEKQKTRAKEDMYKQTTRLKEEFDRNIVDLKDYHGRFQSQTGGSFNMMADGLTRQQKTFNDKIEKYQKGYDNTIEDIDTNITRTVEDVDEAIKRAKADLDKGLDKVKTDTLYNLIMLQESGLMSEDETTMKIRDISSNTNKFINGAMGSFYDTMMKEIDAVNYEMDKGIEQQIKQQELASYNKKTLTENNYAMLKGSNVSSLADQYKNGSLTLADYNSLANGMVSVGTEMLKELGDPLPEDLQLYSDLVYNQNLSPNEAVSYVAQNSNGRLKRTDPDALAREKYEFDKQMSIEKFNLDKQKQQYNVDKDMYDYQLAETEAKKEEAGSIGFMEGTLGFMQSKDFQEAEGIDKLGFLSKEEVPLSEIVNTAKKDRSETDSEVLRLAEKATNDVVKNLNNDYENDVDFKKTGDTLENLLNDSKGFEMQSGVEYIPYTSPEITIDGKVFIRQQEKKYADTALGELNNKRVENESLKTSINSIEEKMAAAENSVQSSNLPQDIKDQIVENGGIFTSMDAVADGLGAAIKSAVLKSEKEGGRPDVMGAVKNLIEQSVLDSLGNSYSQLDEETKEKVKQNVIGLIGDFTMLNAKIVRSVLGEVGVVTDNDITRAETAIGSMFLGSGQISFNIDTMLNLIDSGYQQSLFNASRYNVNLSTFAEDINYGFENGKRINKDANGNLIRDENGLLTFTEGNKIWESNTGEKYYTKNPKYKGTTTNFMDTEAQKQQSQAQQDTYIDDQLKERLNKINSLKTGKSLIEEKKEQFGFNYQGNLGSEYNKANTEYKVKNINQWSDEQLKQRDENMWTDYDKPYI